MCKSCPPLNLSLVYESGKDVEQIGDVPLMTGADGLLDQGVAAFPDLTFSVRGDSGAYRLLFVADENPGDLALVATALFMSGAVTWPIGILVGSMRTAQAGSGTV